MKDACLTLHLQNNKDFPSFGFQFDGGVDENSLVKVIHIEPKSPAHFVETKNFNLVSNLKDWYYKS